MRRKSIIRRWLTNNVSIIVVILMLIVWAVGTSVQNYYYYNVRQVMEVQAGVIMNSLSSLDTSRDGYYEYILRQIENFAATDKMELMALDRDNEVLISSRGFASEENYLMPEFDESTVVDSVSFRGRTINNQHYMAYTVALPEESREIVRLRFVTSLERVDSQIQSIVILVTLIGIGIIFLVTYSGMYFIRSIVIPVGQVSSIARKIAMGDFTTRLNVSSGDEIGELCEAINYMAEELSQADQVKNEFISSVSHELRTPLTAIRGWAETLTETGPEESEMLERGMKVILSETERLGSMVEELLDFSRLQSGRFSMMMEETDVLAELEETVIVFGERARREGVTIDLDEPEYVSPVMGDHNRLRQVLVNVLDNALKYTESGGSIQVTVRETGDEIVIQIADDGCGISEEDLPQVKTKFYKGKGARRGSGIGLAVVDEIVTRHNGKFEIDSVAGEGTTVTFRLPTIRKAAVE